jgi:Holliday junction resolvase RusA-like endonuclease
LDNIIKVVDGCNKIIFKDDVQIYSIVATKSYMTNLNHYGVYCCFEWED